MNFGLYELLDDSIYQVRGFDLSNITFIRGDTGWIIFDPLASKETAAAALKLLNDTVGELPVKAVVYSHSHADHSGSAAAVKSASQAGLYAAEADAAAIQGEIKPPSPPTPLYVKPFHRPHETGTEISNGLAQVEHPIYILQKNQELPLLIHCC